MNARMSLRPLVAGDAHGALTPNQRIAIDGSRFPYERAEALFLAVGPQLGRHLAARYPISSVDIADVVSALWIKVLNHIGTFRDQGDTEVASWHQLRGWVHAIAVNEARDRAGVVKRRNEIRSYASLDRTRILALIVAGDTDIEADVIGQSMTADRKALLCAAMRDLTTLEKVAVMSGDGQVLLPVDILDMYGITWRQLKRLTLRTRATIRTRLIALNASRKHPVEGIPVFPSELTGGRPS